MNGNLKEVFSEHSRKMMMLLGLGQLTYLDLNLFSNCPLFPFPQSSRAIVGCHVTFVILKVLMSSAVACLGLTCGNQRNS